MAAVRASTRCSTGSRIRAAPVFRDAGEPKAKQLAEAQAWLAEHAGAK